MARVSARVICEIEVEVGEWNASATFDQLKEQVRREGRNLVESLFSDQARLEPLRGRVVSVPKVKLVAVDE